MGKKTKTLFSESWGLHEQITFLQSENKKLQHSLDEVKTENIKVRKLVVAAKDISEACLTVIHKIQYRVSNLKPEDAILGIEDDIIFLLLAQENNIKLLSENYDKEIWTFFDEMDCEIIKLNNLFFHIKPLIEKLYIKIDKEIIEEIKYHLDEFYKIK